MRALTHSRIAARTPRRGPYLHFPVNGHTPDAECPHPPIGAPYPDGDIRICAQCLRTSRTLQARLTAERAKDVAAATIPIEQRHRESMEHWRRIRQERARKGKKTGARLVC